ncbi:MAG TPA: Gfo/Idh/MocA family oxidoreductase [Caulobacteraceae bacterium]|jgi:predicted dehydrogenase|nr:Gfo/Idh/MocA family oxidoreductase [Caulobacteraceae bacterium]
MLNAAIVGLGWWGGTLVDAVQGGELIRFTAAATRTRSDKDRLFAEAHNLRLETYADLLADPDIHAVVLATPPSGHRDQIVAAARAGKHVFCEKPFTMSKAEAEEAVGVMEKAGLTLALGYNRRFHPSWIDLKRRLQSGELGTILHMECTLGGPNALSMTQKAWRAQAEEAPCGGLFPMGVHAVDGFIDLAGEIDQVFCQSLHRAAPVQNDDTTSILLRLKAGMSAYIGTMTATAGAFRFAAYGSKAMARLGGATHVAGQSSHQRRAGLFGSYMIQPVKGEAEWIDVPEFDVNRAELDAFAVAATDGVPYPVPYDQMIQGVAATDAIIASARSGRMETVK